MGLPTRRAYRCLPGLITRLFFCLFLFFPFDATRFLPLGVRSRDATRFHITHTLADEREKKSNTSVPVSREERKREVKEGTPRRRKGALVERDSHVSTHGKRGVDVIAALTTAQL